MTDGPALPFDARLGRLRRARAGAGKGDAFWLHRRAAEELLDRLELVARPFAAALELSSDPWLGDRLAERGLSVLRVDEADLPGLPPASMDLAVSVGLLDTINDLPGALALLRRTLKPDGLFLAAFAGAGSLPRLRQAMRAAEAAEGLDPSPRIHPQIDVRAAGDLLTRAGFALPVADREVVEVRYASLPRLLADLRLAGATNILAQRARRPFTRLGFAAATAEFGESAVERFELIFLSGWAPAPSQPAPARRGSGTASLADALKPGGSGAR
ncbi:MAG TPA: methyltransferase domain-containing protein [Allosphingosinicella sp.]|nr:methyltransferase domain-containing protein [Allosphingosinicella sp.]